MAIAFVNSAVGLGGGTSAVTDPAISHTAGNLIVVLCWAGADDSNVSGVTDTAGNTYLEALRVVALGATAEIWYAYNCLGHATNVVTVTRIGAGFQSLIVSQYAGVMTAANPFEVAASGSGLSSPVASGSFAPAATGNLHVAVSCNGNGDGTYTAGTGYALRTNEATQNVQSEDDLDAASGSQTVEMANNGASPLLIIGVASFKAPAGGGPVTHNTTSHPLGLRRGTRRRIGGS